MAIDSGRKSLGNLFAGEIRFSIPNYQRGYAWGNRQIYDLIEDLNTAAGEKTHFYGTVLLRHLKTDRHGYDVYEIVDGQQRITTAIILVSEVLRRLSASLDSRKTARFREHYVECDNVPKLTLPGIDQNFFEEFILGKQTYPDIPETPSQRHLKNARELIRSEFEELQDQDVEKFLNRINRLEVLVYSVSNRAEAALIFETTNARGIDLTSIEKTKSFLMYNIYIVSKNPDRHLEQINKIFTQIYPICDFLENNHYHRIEDWRVQRYSFVLFFDWQSKEDYTNLLEFLKNDIRKHVTNKPKNAPSYIREYCKSLYDTFFAIKEIIEAAENAAEPIGLALHDIFLLNRPANFFPLLVASWLQYRQGKYTKEKFLRFLQAVETFAFRCYAIGGRRADAGELDIYGCAFSLYRNEQNIEGIRKKILSLCDSYTPDMDFREALSARNFRRTINGRDIKYLLLKYEEYLAGSRQPREPGMIDRSNVFSEAVEIEHILPVNNKYSQSFNEQYLHRLGNLALASKPSNISMSNKSFAQKVKKYYKNSSFRMQRDLAKYKSWNRKAILERERRIINFATKHWGISS